MCANCHTIEVDLDLGDVTAFNRACQRVNAEFLPTQTVKLYETKHIGHAARLQGWMYPIVYDQDQQKTFFDNYNGAWGDPQELDRFMQAYAVEKTLLTAQEQGHVAQVRNVEGGGIQVIMDVGDYS